MLTIALKSRTVIKPTAFFWVKCYYEAHMLQYLKFGFFMYFGN